MLPDCRCLICVDDDDDNDDDEDGEDDDDDGGGGGGVPAEEASRSASVSHVARVMSDRARKPIGLRGDSWRHVGWMVVRLIQLDLPSCPQRLAATAAARRLFRPHRGVAVCARDPTHKR